MPYRQALIKDIRGDDPASPDYNCWVRKGMINARSYERLKRYDLYKYCILS
jgi:L,D-peptidoglycan transpeptidase YkuD (ErfK/YbiS/YcfS/YnhG family)